jgi:hypothetical protein
MVGQVVWYRTCSAAEPFAAIIAKVNANGTVNLAVFAGTGEHYWRQNIDFCQSGLMANLYIEYCEPVPCSKLEERVAQLEWLVMATSTPVVQKTFTGE